MRPTVQDSDIEFGTTESMLLEREPGIQQHLWRKGGTCQA
jgi:hypothetical protein